jgi:hypothetical protein
MTEEVKRLIAQFELDIRRGNNGKEYCNNACTLVNLAKDAGLKTKEVIAKVIDAVPGTITTWEKKGYGDPTMCRHLDAHLKSLVT